jgi:hypothetical protein
MEVAMTVRFLGEITNGLMVVCLVAISLVAQVDARHLQQDRGPHITAAELTHIVCTGKEPITIMLASLALYRTRGQAPRSATLNALLADRRCQISRQFVPEAVARYMRPRSALLRGTVSAQGLPVEKKAIEQQRQITVVRYAVHGGLRYGVFFGEGRPAITVLYHTL